MIQEIGLMIGAYTFTRMLSFMLRKDGRAEHTAVRVFALLGMIATVLISLDLLFRSTPAGLR